MFLICGLRKTNDCLLSCSTYFVYSISYLLEHATHLLHLLLEENILFVNAHYWRYCEKFELCYILRFYLLRNICAFGIPYQSSGTKLDAFFVLIV